MRSIAVGLLIGLIFAQPARADIFKSTLFSLNTIYLDRDYDNNGVKSKSKETDTDLRLMRIEKNWAYGGIYSISSNDSSDSNRTSYGISGGYFSDKDFYIAAHYFLSSKYKAGGGVEYSKGTGYGIDLGFLTKITTSFYAGLVFIHRSYSYSEQNSSAGSSSVSVSHRELIPMFTFGVVFQ